MPARTTETAAVPEDVSGRPRRLPVGSVTWRHTFRALRHRNYRLFFWGQLVSLVGTWMQQTAMSWFVYQITNSKLLLGTVAAVGVATCFFLNGVTFIAVIAGLLMMRLPEVTRPMHALSASKHAWNGIVYSIKHQRVRTILLLFLAVGVFGWSSAVLMPAFARDVLGRGAKGYGVLMS